MSLRIQAIPEEEWWVLPIVRLFVTTDEINPDIHTKDQKLTVVLKSSLTGRNVETSCWLRDLFQALEGAEPGDVGVVYFDGRFRHCVEAAELLEWLEAEDLLKQNDGFGFLDLTTHALADETKEAIEAYHLGLYGDPNDPETRTKLMERLGLDPTSGLAIDYAKAESERTGWTMVDLEAGSTKHGDADMVVTSHGVLPEGEARDLRLEIMKTRLDNSFVDMSELTVKDVRAAFRIPPELVD